MTWDLFCECISDSSVYLCIYVTKGCTFVKCGYILINIFELVISFLSLKAVVHLIVMTVQCSTLEYNYVLPEKQSPLICFLIATRNSSSVDKIMHS